MAYIVRKTDDSFQVSVNNICLAHDEELKYYCTLHEDLLCRKCVKSEHQSCPPQASASETAKSSKDAVSSMLEKNLKITIENVVNAVQHQHDTLVTLEEKQRKAKGQIQEIRDTLNKKIDELEDQLMHSFNETREKFVPAIQKDLSKLEKREKDVKDIENKISKIREFGSDLDFFLAARQVNEKLLEEEENVTKSVENLRGVNLDFSINKDIESLISKITKIGDLFVDEIPCSLSVKPLVGRKKKIVDIPVSADTAVKKVVIDEIDETQTGEDDGIFKLKFVLRNKFEMTKGFLKKDLCICNGILTKDQIVFTDRENKRFIVTSTDGDHLHNMDVTGRPWGISIIDETRVVVTFPYMGSGYLEILDFKNNKVEKAISIGGLCRGVSYYNGLIYVVVYGQGIQVVDLEGNVKSNIPVNVNGVFHMVVNDEKIIYTDEWTHTLHCCDLSGNEIWHFNNDRLKQPQGITVDENGNVYVASYFFDNVTVVSPDGQKHREVLNKSNGLLGPSSVFYDKRKDYLLVSSREHGRVAVFHVLMNNLNSFT